MEESTTIRLVAIYDAFKDNKDVYLDTVAIVRCNNDNDDYKVISGKYIEKDSSFFNEIKALDGNLLNFPNEIKQVTNNKNKKNIYFFDQEFFKQRINMNEKSIKSVLLSLILKLNDIYLHINNDETIFTVYNKNEKVPDTNEIDKIKNGNIDDLADEVFNREEFEKSIRKIFENLLLHNNNDGVEDSEEIKSFVPVAMIGSFSPEPNKIPAFEKFREKEIKKEREKNHFSNYQIVNEMIEKISNKIVGQDDAIKTLVSNIYYNQVLIEHLEKEGEIDPSRLDSSKVAILLDGETGTGKTAIEKEIARMLDIPIVITNANSFSETGYVGPTITDILENLVDQTKGDINKAERGIVVLDEIDKVASKDEIYGKDMDKGVQEELLSFIGGGEYDVRINEGLFGKMERFDTSKLTFILSGAFTDLRDKKIKEAEKKYNTIGFGINKESDYEKTYTILPEDYIEYGLIREFFGRIKVLTSTRSYKFEDYKKILLTSEVSPLRNFEKSVIMFGYKGISYDEEFVDRLAKEALEMKTGARALQTIMSGIQNKLLLGLINHEFDGDIIYLTTSLVDDYKKANIREY